MVTSATVAMFLQMCPEKRVYGRPSQLAFLVIRDRGMRKIILDKYDGGEVMRQVVLMKWIESHGRKTIIQAYMC